ncbi:MAG: hypothetical protein ABII12_12145 [Planctomycetota bacterium]|nr:hypothetical protein [Planctomycetota bacterium]
MMKATMSQRLSDVEAALTPKQAAILEVAKGVEQFDDCVQYVQAHTDPATHPRNRLAERVAQSVEAACKAKKASPEHTARAIRTALLDADSRFMLAAHCNIAIQEDSVSNARQSRLLAVEVAYILRTIHDEASAQRIADWQEETMAHLGELYSIEKAIERIRERYFDGRPILFRGTAADLRGQIDMMEQTIGFYNAAFNATPASDCLVVDVEVVRRDAETRVDEKISQLTDQAKIDALWALGEVQAAREVFRPYAAGQRQL